MSRLITSSLILIIIFLMGMVFGMNQESMSSETQSPLSEATHFEEEEEEEVIIVNESPEQEEEDMEENASALSMTQKTASVLEMGVKGFYEMVVDVLYQIAQLFF